MKDAIQSSRPLGLTSTSFILAATIAVLVISILAACSGPSVSSAGVPRPTAFPWNPSAKKTMRAFTSEEELKRYFRQLAEERKKEYARARREAGANPPAPLLKLRRLTQTRRPQMGSRVKTNRSPTINMRAWTRAISLSCTAIIWSYFAADVCLR
jgi:hypothetical protein